MTPTAYQAAAARTLPAAMADRDRLSMLALGVVGEWGEYAEADLGPESVVEAGDVLWYIAGLCTVLGVDMTTLGLHNTGIGRDVCALSDISEPIKKHLYHGKPLDKARILRGCARLYMGIVYNHDLPTVMAANVDKLKARWPDGFRVCA